ncbi:hypothetical protein FGG08_002480 [Glutinoglossum americanum]|uniref:Uncharacterized protein n=1 Tax=Glutinoglossum americanum TaxID=1670608 RepID=A0A9P8I9M3_9PEZI|nr:hypothetical protein FGG08_002480 [Glutinoglossum americanum]
MPIVLHAVPPEERAVGADGKQKPFAIVERAPLLDGEESLRFKRTPSGNRATGSFGRSKRQSTRTRTAPFKDDWNLTTTDDMWKNFLTKQTEAHQQEQQRNATLSQSASQNLITSTASASQTNTATAGTSAATPAGPKSDMHEPTEVILRGFQPSRSYAAIDKYEKIGGMICEDFPRTEFDNPSRDPAILRDRPLTREELKKANALAMGEHWIKVTFESRYAAERALRASPQEIYGHWVYAEPYKGVPLPASEDYKIPANDRENPPPPPRQGSSFQTATAPLNLPADKGTSGRTTSSTLPRSFTTGSLQATSPATSSATSSAISPLSSSLPTPTHRRTRSSSTTLPPPTLQPTAQTHPELFCRRIPTARRVQLLPAEQAVLPKPSWFSLLLANLGMAALFGGLEECNRLEDGRFDWANSSWYWRLWWCLEVVLGGNFTGTRYGWAEGPGEPNVGPDGTVYPS